MRARRLWLVVTAFVATGCYAGARAAQGINAAWSGRDRAEIEEAWGEPEAVEEQEGLRVLRWSDRRDYHIGPIKDVEIKMGPRYFEGIKVTTQTPRSWTEVTHVAAWVDASGKIVQVQGYSLRWGPPRDANLRWGFLLGMHVGMGALDDARRLLPSGGVHIGGLLARDLGLVGTFSFCNGLDAAGPAMGFAWGMAVQWWPATRVWLRAGPAAVLDLDPGLVGAAFSPGLTTGVSYAFVRYGALVLDLRLDLTVSPSALFGFVGAGVNIN